MTWYAGVEMWLTFTLAKATHSTNLTSFDMLTKGMDARVKLSRLREASKTFKPIGPKLSARFDFFEKSLIPLRNRLMHSHLSLERDGNNIAITKLSSIPPRGQLPKPADLMPSLELFEYGAWLFMLNNDVKSACRGLARSQMIEIDNPESPLPPQAQPDRLDKVRHAIGGKRDRKRLRKGQAPRRSQ